MNKEPSTYYDVKCGQPYVLTADTTHLRDIVVPAGTIVYKSEECDYGLANDDTRATGEEYISMTTVPSGRMTASAKYPFGPFSFTVPIRILKEHLPNDKPKNIITVTIEGGIVQDVIGIPTGYELRVEDHDEGDESHPSWDAKKECFVTIYEGYANG